VIRRIVVVVLVSGLFVVGAATGLPGNPKAAVSAAGAPPATPGSIPTASQVLDRMMTAWQTAGSDHFTVAQSGQWAIKGGRRHITVVQTGDVSWGNPPTFQMQGPYLSVKVRRNELVFVLSDETQLYAQNRLAVRFGTGKWSCNSFYGYSDLPGDPEWDGTSPYGLVGKNLGIKTVDGIPAWHVRSVYTVAAPKGGKSPKLRVIRNYYAAVADYRPVEFRIYTRYLYRGSIGKFTDVMRFSNFGETVNVTLPSVCKG